MTPAAITKALHSRGVLAATAVTVFLCTLVAYALTHGTMVFETRGFVGQFGRQWLLPRGADLLLQLSLNAVMVWLMLHLNKLYNLLRSYTMLHASFFLLIQLATPSLMLYVCPGTVLAIVMMACVIAIFMVYDSDFFDTRNVFFVFMLLSACMSFEYSFALFIPAFIIACGQMRIFSMRTVVAILLGLVTPWIIFFGFGIVTPADLTLPDIHLRVPRAGNPRTSLMLLSVGYTCFVTVFCILQNTIKILSYNARSRAMLSVLATLSVFTILASIIDFGNIYAYLTLLNCCAALQLAHLFGAIHTFAKSYIAISVIAGLYLILFLMHLIILS